jgi:hypothetical protein
MAGPPVDEIPMPDGEPVDALDVAYQRLREALDWVDAAVDRMETNRPVLCWRIALASEIVASILFGCGWCSREMCAMQGHEVPSGLGLPRGQGSLLMPAAVGEFARSIGAWWLIFRRRAAEGDEAVRAAVGPV